MSVPRRGHTGRRRQSRAASQQPNEQPVGGTAPEADAPRNSVPWGGCIGGMRSPPYASSPWHSTGTSPAAAPSNVTEGTTPIITLLRAATGARIAMAPAASASAPTKRASAASERSMRAMGRRWRDGTSRLQYRGGGVGGI
eukprot:scaffold164_cov105-Isochrysis_galbana.AAC.7